MITRRGQLRVFSIKAESEIPLLNLFASSYLWSPKDASQISSLENGGAGTFLVCSCLFCEAIGPCCRILRISTSCAVPTGFTESQLQMVAAVKQQVLNHNKHIGRAPSHVRQFLDDYDRLAVSLEIADAVFFIVATTMPHLRALEGFRLTTTTLMGAFADLHVLAVARNSPLSSLEGLSSCSFLRRLVVTGCDQLCDFRDISSQPYLQSIVAQFTGVGSLAGLTRQTSPVLAELSLSHCKSLFSLNELGALPSLRTLHLAFSSVAALRGLHHCTNLRTLTLSHCKNLLTLDGIGRLEHLSLLTVTNASLASCSGLDGGSMPSLAKIDVSYCKRLLSFEGFTGSFESLRHIDAQSSGLVRLNHLGSTCPNLQILDLTGCTALRALSGLCGQQPLSHIYAGLTSLTTLEDLKTCGFSDTKFVVGCEHLQKKG